MNMNVNVKQVFSKSFPYLIIAAVCLVLYLFLANRTAAVRIGDGAEYYCNFLSFQTIQRPWMEKASFDSYENLRKSGTVQGLIPRKILEKLFPDLRLNGSYDFNHFWFYSFLAYIIYSCFQLIGIVLSPHNAFLILHCILFGVVCAVCFHYYRWKGLFGILLFFIGSPLIWNIAYVHTEFFTFTLSLLAIVLLMNSLYLSAALALAVASTQNPPFAIIAFVVFVFHFIRNWRAPFTLTDVILIVATGFITFLHPVYYFFRYGVLTPQLLSEGAEMGCNLRHWYVYFLDPDLGLLLQWPLGTVILIFFCAAVLIRRKQIRHDILTRKYLLVFIFFYLAICIFAHASTQNLNSGGCISLPRYALWYVPLFFTLFLFLLPKFLKFNRWAVLFWLIVFLCIVVNVIQFYPNNSESYCKPSLPSFYIQKYLPGLYNPPPEVFMERYSGYGEYSEAYSVQIIVGPDGHKALINPKASGKYYPAAIGTQFPSGDRVKLLVDHLAKGKKKPFYTFLNDEQIAGLQATLPLSTDIPMQMGRPEFSLLRNGWTSHEPWGTWSEGHHAEIVIPYSPNQAYYGKPFVRITLKLHPFFKEQRLAVSMMGKELYSGKFKGESSVAIRCPLDEVHAKKMDCFILDLKLPDAVAPSAVVKSQDNRLLGIGLHSIRFDLQPGPLGRICKTLPLNSDIATCVNTLGLHFLDSGWSSPEPWGTWSEGHHAKIIIPYASNQPYFGKPFVRITLKLHPFFKEQRLAVSMMGKELYSGKFKGESSVTIRCPLDEVHAKKMDCFILDLKLPDAVAPSAVAKSPDNRVLGIGLHSIRFGLPGKDKK